MTVVFDKYVSENITQQTEIAWGIHKDSEKDFCLFFSANIIYELQHYNNRKSLSAVKSLYSDFVSREEFQRYVVKEQLVFGRQGRKPVAVDSEGIREFLSYTMGRLIIDGRNLDNLCEATLKAVKSLNLSSTPTSLSPYILQEHLLTFAKMYMDDAVYSFLNSSNICYVFELVDDFFYVGHTLVQFKYRLRNHKAFEARRFKSLYSAYSFKKDAEIDASVLENCIHMAGSRVLGIDKVQLEKTTDGSGFKCTESQMREIIDTALLNPRVSFHACAERVPSFILSQIKAR